MQKLDADELKKYTSNYLTVGRKEEHWEIDNVEIEGKCISASISMKTCYVSGTDAGGFHLTIFSALEFVSQLMIIYAHIWADLDEKTQEGWMVNSSIKSSKAIRDPLNMKTSMTINMKKVGKHLYGIGDFKITDKFGGLFEGRIKGFLA